MNNPANNPSSHMSEENPLLSIPIDGLTKPQLAELALRITQQCEEAKAGYDLIDDQIKQATLERKMGKPIDTDWMRRARYAMHKKRETWRKLKAFIKQINVALNGNHTGETEYGTMKKESALARQQLHEEQLRTVNIKREQENERLRLAALKKEEKESIKFMRAAKVVLDEATYSMIERKSGIKQPKPVIPVVNDECPTVDFNLMAMEA
jgi:hypothetical protein